MTLRRLLATSLCVAVACGGKPAGPSLAPSGPPMPPPMAIAASARGASYLTAIAAQIQPAWAQFLEDCRFRLARTHPLNQPSLVATAELTIGRDGRVDVRIATGSGNGDFDTAVFDVLGDASPLPAPPPDLISDDDVVHLRWLFARDVRQAGPATAQVVDLHLPLLTVVDRLIERKALARAVERVALAAAGDSDRAAATERVMIASLREALFSSDSAARRAAVDAIARAGVHSLAREVHTLAGPIADRDLRIVAITASAQLGDPIIAPTLAADLGSDLENQPRIALAKIEALAVLGRGALAAPGIQRAFARGPSATALAALALVPDPVVAAKLSGWLASSDAGLRASVCTALPAAATDPSAAIKLVAKGLRDADATVRARCLDAVSRGGIHGPAADRAIQTRLHELARDRDRAVRARAIAALGTVEPNHRLRAIDDPGAEVRAASAIGASESELRTLAADKDPDVRATALATLGDRAPDLAIRGAEDLSAAVRKVAIAVIVDEALLGKLASDNSPDVATAAVVRLAQHRGRAAITDLLLAGLITKPPTPVRVRIALAWLLAR